MRRRASVTIVLIAAIAAPQSAQAETCADASAQNAFSARVAFTEVAVGRSNPLSVASPSGVTYSSGDWSRDPRVPARVVLDDPTAAVVREGSDDVDDFIVPRRTGTIGATVSWSQTTNDSSLTCERSQHISFEAIAGKPPPATVVGARTGDYERNVIGGGLTVAGCAANARFAIEPVSWTLYYTGDGRTPSRRSPRLRWGSPDPCAEQDKQRLTGPRYVRNRTLQASAGPVFGYSSIEALPVKRGTIRGLWEVRIGTRLVKSTRFKWVYGRGFRTAQGRRYPITGWRLARDAGACPGLPCTSWILRPGY